MNKGKHLNKFSCSACFASEARNNVISLKASLNKGLSDKLKLSLSN